MSPSEQIQWHPSRSVSNGSYPDCADCQRPIRRLDTTSRKRPVLGRHAWSARWRVGRHDLALGSSMRLPDTVFFGAGRHDLDRPWPTERGGGAIAGQRRGNGGGSVWFRAGKGWCAHVTVRTAFGARKRCAMNWKEWLAEQHVGEGGRGRAAILGPQAVGSARPAPAIEGHAPHVARALSGGRRADQLDHDTLRRDMSLAVPRWQVRVNPCDSVQRPQSAHLWKFCQKFFSTHADSSGRMQTHAGA